MDPGSSTARPTDATLSVTKAARLLGVHPNTIRAWSDQGRLRYYRINPRGDRRYRLGDLQGFLAAAEAPAVAPVLRGPGGRGGTGRPAGRPPLPASPESGGGTTVGVGRQPRHGPIGGTPLDTAIAAPRPARRRGDRLARGGAAVEPAADGAVHDRRTRDLRLLADLAALTAGGRDRDHTLVAAISLIAETYGYQSVAAYEQHDDLLVLRASFPTQRRPIEVPVAFGTAGRALEDDRPVLVRADTAGWQPIAAGSRAEIAVPILAGTTRWGALVIASDRLDGLSQADVDVADALARQVGVGVYSAGLLDEATQQVHRLDALRRVAADIAGRLDLEQMLDSLIDHARVLFKADRAAIFLRHADGSIVAEVAHALSAEYLAAVRDFPTPSLPASAALAREPLYAVGYADDPRGGAMRAAVIQEGFDTLCTAPLFDRSELVGFLNVYHDRPHPWSQGELDTMAAFATQAAVAIKTAQTFGQMATWAAHLQSIQQLGARLNGLTSVTEIGSAIATELRQLIDYHNVRVYRLYDRDLIPVAMLGQVGEYVDETPEQLKVALGEGITGWVAEHKLAEYLPDAAGDTRANTIPGTEEDLDESMLLAPMIFEDRVLGVVVLSKLGLHQFSDDDLRLLVIYASFAAQAMANADTNEALRSQTAALERQLRSQRELLHVTESILVTLDSRAVLDQITERLDSVVHSDNVAIELFDRAAGVLRPLTAKGVNADQYLEEWLPGEEGLATWVVAHNEPQLVVDELADGRVSGAVEGSLICVPLRGRDGAVGVLTLERLGPQDRFTEEEYDLVQLFAAQVSIALQNAETHRAISVRARTDSLTGLLNYGTFQDRLSLSVDEGAPFSLVMIDLDDFKAVNDALGHQAGDRLLHDIASAIVAAGRESDLVFRYGGDEFALLLPGTDRSGATQVAERIRSLVEAVGAPHTPWHEEGLEVSASIGLATFPDDGPTSESILLAADRACFVAKRSGHGQIATADEGRALAAEFSLQEPTPVDPPSLSI